MVIDASDEGVACGGSALDVRRDDVDLAFQARPAHGQ
jgi:hypothetical protein